MRIGQFDVFQVVIDRFRLDGGAMFGAVPKPLWQRVITADEDNGIPLCCRALVLRSTDRLIVVDIGCGDKWEEKQRKIYRFAPQVSVRRMLADVTDIVLTHLHFDHAGGISALDESGTPELCYPQARVHLQSCNWNRAQNPGPRERATYLAANVEPLRRAVLDLHASHDTIAPGLELFELHGHTDGMQGVRLTDGRDTLVYPADLIPTAHHVPIPWVMGYDLCASTTMKEKEDLLSRAAEEGWLIVFGHDAHTCAARVARDERGAFFVSERIELPAFSVAQEVG